MTAADRKLIAIQVAEEIVKLTDDVLTVEDVRKMFDLKTKNGVYMKIKRAKIPVHKKEGMGCYFFKSEIIKFLKS